MTGTTEGPIGDLVHCRLGCSNTHLESELRMADPALVSNTVKPVRKDDGPHTLNFGLTIQNHVSILGMDNLAGEKGKAEYPDLEWST